MQVLFGGYSGDRNNHRGGYDRLGFRPMETRPGYAAEQISALAPVANGVGVEIESVQEHPAAPDLAGVVPEPRSEVAVQDAVATGKILG